MESDSRTEYLTHYVMEVNFSTDHIFVPLTPVLYTNYFTVITFYTYSKQVIMENQCTSSQCCETFSFGQIGKI